MNNQQKATLENLWKTPTPKALEWARIETLLVSAGARVIEGRGSRVRF